MTSSVYNSARFAKIVSLSAFIQKLVWNVTFWVPYSYNLTNDYAYQQIAQSCYRLFRRFYYENLRQ